eukprot:3197885-Rhodomonas_salina.1
MGPLAFRKMPVPPTTWDGRQLSFLEMHRNVKNACVRSQEELESALTALLNRWPSARFLLVKTLIEVKRLPLHEAFHLICKLGFHLDHTGILRPVLWILELRKERQDEIYIGLQDFNLALRHWSRLDADVQNFFGIRFLSYWQSPRGQLELHGGAAESLEYGDSVAKYKLIWDAVAQPTMAQKLTPDRMCKLKWPPLETVMLMDRFVDTAGDAAELVRELRSRDMLTAALLTQHEGMIRLTPLPGAALA